MVYHTQGFVSMKNEDDTSKLNSRCSRGYAGYFTTQKGEVLYLRSLKEFIVASWLSSLETDNITLRGEWYIENYRPDFRVEVNSKTRLVVEVKDNKRDAMIYYAKYKSIINALGYRYIIIYSTKTFNRIIKKFSLEVEEWKRNSVYDYSGQNNPKFGLTLSDETKMLIGQKTSERYKDPEYKSRLRAAISAGMTPEVRKKIGENTRYYAKLREEERNIKDPFIEAKCVWCGTPKIKRASRVKDVEFCDARCAGPYYASIGQSRKFDSNERFARMQLNLLSFGRKIKIAYGDISEDIIKSARMTGVIPKNCQLSINSITKYFSNIESFKEILCQN